MAKRQSLGSVCSTQPNAKPDLRPVEGAAADQELALLAKALAHPARVQILRLLSKTEVCVCGQIVKKLPLAQSTVSEHLRILKEAGLVRSHEEGVRALYCINHAVLRRFKALVAVL